MEAKPTPPQTATVTSTPVELAASGQKEDEIVFVVDVEDDVEVPGRLPLPPPSKLPWYKDDNARRVILMAFLTGLFCLGEIAAGLAVNSLAILSDAFHMISDELSLIIGFVALRMAVRPGTKNMSYGYRRAEILGALVNGIFLITVALFIILDAIERFMEPPKIKSGMVIVIVGVSGLLVNVVGLVIFAGHAHIGHNHDHGGHGHGGHDHGHEHSHSHGGHDHEHEHEHEGHDGKHEEKAEKHSNLNLHGMFLHLLGDALGSVSATIVGLIIWFVPTNDDGSDDDGPMPWKYYMDPAASIIVAIIIVNSGIPLVVRCVRILMQSTPSSVDVDEITKEIRSIEGIRGVHDIHLWQLGNATYVGTLHIVCEPKIEFASFSMQLEELLHKHNIHKTTIQVESASDEQGGADDGTTCMFSCDFDESHAETMTQCSLLKRAKAKADK